MSEEPPFAKARSKVNIAAKVRSPCSDPKGIAPSTSVESVGKVPTMSR